MLDWKRPKDELPEVGEDILVYNEDIDRFEFGFRSAVDIDSQNWADFSFPVQYWAYCNYPG